MRKCGLCCQTVSVRWSVRLYCIQMAEDITKLLSQPGSPIILVFLPKLLIPNGNSMG